MASREAIVATKKAEEAAEEARTRAYVAEMNLAPRAWEGNDIVRLLDLLEKQRPEHTGDKDMRGFEWYYWWRLTHTAFLTIDKSRGVVNSVAFSPDGKRIASGGQDGKVLVWDAEKGGAALLRLQGHVGTVTSVAFSSDGKRIASGGGWDGTVRVWDAEKGGAARIPIQAHTDRVTTMFSPDGKPIALVTDLEGKVPLWDAEKGSATLRSLQGFTRAVTTLAFSSDGKRIASGGLDKTVRVWDAEKGEEASDPSRDTPNRSRA
jgi:WD40 repeat protein